MRLINTETGEFEDFSDLETTPRYAILSHTWDEDGEQTYQEVLIIQKKYRHLRPPPKDSLSNLHSDEPGAVPQILNPSEACTTSRSPLPASTWSPLWYFVFLVMLPLWCKVVFLISHAWISRMHGPATPSPSEPDPPNDTQTPPTVASISRPSIWDPESGLSEKIRRICEIARRDGYGYIWIDSCCIDKANIPEMGDAITSMYNWYRGAQVCYAFLADVPSGERSKFNDSRWFKRGWTLQELIAPLVVVFLSNDWQYYGTKDGLANIIENITSINIGILTHERTLREESVANRMRWAAQRKTARVEDQAYSLLGIFGITMPTLYGEGENAFRRLQEEILQRIPDQSIFIWGIKEVSIFPLTPYEMNVYCTDTKTLLASSLGHFQGPPARFIKHQTLLPLEDSIVESLGLPVEEYTRTPYGIRTQLCLLPLETLNPHFHINVEGGSSLSWHLIILRRSRYANDPQLQRRLLIMSRLCYLRTETKVPFLYMADGKSRPGEIKSMPTLHGDEIFALPLDYLSRIKESLQTKTIYLPHPKPPAAAKRQLRAHKSQDNTTLRFSLPARVKAVLHAGGYTVFEPESSIAVTVSTRDDPTSFSFTLLHSAFKTPIHVHFRGMVGHAFQYGETPVQVVTIEARLWILSPGEEPPQTDTTIQLSPPYTSATWVDRYPWAMTLPARSLTLVVGSGDQETKRILRLGLDLTAGLQYNLRVDVQAGLYINTEVGASFHAHLKDIAVPYVHGVEGSHGTKLNLILLGSARRALEMKGYSASTHLALGPSLHSPYDSLSLTLTSTRTDSDPDKFAIVVKYLHGPQDLLFLREDPHSKLEDFVMVARITLESLTSDDSSKTVQDGPHIVIWEERHPWKWSLEEKHVVLTTLTGTSLTLHLGLVFAWCSEYYLDVDIDVDSKTDTPFPQLPSRERFPIVRINRHKERPESLLGWAHKEIILTLPGHVKRALQDQGYQIRFEGPDRGRKSGDFISHFLTLSHIQAGVTIGIEYSHRLITHPIAPDADVKREPRYYESKYPFLLVGPQPESHLLAPTVNLVKPLACQQELAFKVSVEMSLSHGDRSETLDRVAVQGDDTTASTDWNAKYAARVWPRHLRQKDLTLRVPNGHELVLRLGFYLVWYSEYCLMVEINPRTPLSRPPSRSEVPPVPDYQLGEDSMEYIRQCFAERTELERSEEAHDEPRPTDPDLAVVHA